MARRPSRAKLRRKNTLTNAFERYELTLTNDALASIAKQIRAGNSNHRQTLSTTRSVHEVTIDGRKIHVIYNKATRQVTIPRKKLRIKRET